ncbi:PREDICTED: PHD finger protein MALE MEIOCYTE DEATH 1 [Tarenaya hassleriana]|uniref:PHD finger protein MALE MEIOCYTE DEATH 1 n=1 Tax=Tarenaya hassleriana TaxID=28532 RepID=UPI00053C5E80|nr:PREDICTED: PHD finger protein MALE MEIOCYTE DEATH 1 [Tarenaya hassleriana]
MPVPIIETCRKRKRKPKMFGFQGFGEHDGFPAKRPGIFRENIRDFLRECAEVEDYSIRGMPVWCTLLNHETKSTVIPLYTIEEDVKHSAEPYCDHCRCTGWSNHFVSKRKYHLIIPIDTEWTMPLEDDAFNLQSHLLHGLIHSNGFGHLICINGIEGGSKHLCGREIMDLWDRLCTYLGARIHRGYRPNTALHNKRSMDLRLLYGVAYGHSWFGRWGYRFCRGSYGVTKNDYENAIDLLSSLELDQIELDFSDEKQSKEMEHIFRYYRELSEGRLKTLRDLLRFMLTIKAHASQRKKLPVLSPTTGISLQKSSSSLFLQKRCAENEKYPKCRRYSNVAASLGSRWPVRRLEYAAEVIVQSLKEMKALRSGQSGMSRQEVRDAARMHIGDTGLLDYVLKSMNNVIVGSVVVRRSVNPTTRILQYTIQELDNETKVAEPEKEIVKENLPLRISIEFQPGADIYRDLFFLYTNVLMNYPESESVNSASQAVLDSKHFVKECALWDDREHVFVFCCRVNPSLVDLRSELITELPPGEMVTVPLQATVSDLKQAIEDNFRDTYCVLANFVVTEIEELGEDTEDEELLFGRIEPYSALTVRGFGIDTGSKLKCQGGSDTWMVRCPCGAHDDDGERMVACDICEVWQHTRCCGIEDSETLPPLFVCTRCCDSFADQQRKLLQPKFEFPSSFDDVLLLEAAEDSSSVFGYEKCLGMILSSDNGFTPQIVL